MSSDMKARLREIYDHLAELIEMAPGPLKPAVRDMIEELKGITLDARPPRLAIIGRRGAGKSSLINAMLGTPDAPVGDVVSTTGKGRWYSFANDQGTIEVLDTRGLGDGTRPEDAEAVTGYDEIVKDLTEKYPDGLIFLCQAKAVDSHIDEDIKGLLRLRAEIQRIHNYLPPVVGVVSQVDELSPASVTTPPFDHPRKQENITHAVEKLREKLAAVDESILVIPTCAYMEFEGETLVLDRRWNIDLLFQHLIEVIPKSAQLGLAQLSKLRSVQRKLALKLVGVSQLLAGGIGTTPIPIADLPLITGVQIFMVMGIGYIAGRQLERKAVLEFLTAIGANVGAAFVVREIVRALARLLPVGGSAISGAAAGMATRAIGLAAIAYFIDGEDPKGHYQAAASAQP